MNNSKHSSLPSTLLIKPKEKIVTLYQNNLWISWCSIIIKTEVALYLTKSMENNSEREKVVD